MTFEEFNDARTLRREIHQLKRTRASLARELSSSASFPELERLISDKQERLCAELERVERYIDAIGDSVTRQMFRDRFVLGMSWVAVAVRVGGSNTASAVEKRVKRYIRKHAAK